MKKKSQGLLKPIMVQVRMTEFEKNELDRLKYETGETFGDIIRRGIFLYGKEKEGKVTLSK